MHGYPDKMTPEQARTFRDDVLNIVSQIPRGRVTTYGHIAALTGWPSHSRMVGRTLRYTPGAEELPCHRVVNKEGRTAPGWSRQRPLLEAEGIHFKPNGHGATSLGTANGIKVFLRVYISVFAQSGISSVYCLKRLPSVVRKRSRGNWLSMELS